MKRLLLGLGFAVICGVAVWLQKPAQRVVLHDLRSDGDLFGVIEERQGKPWVVLAGNDETAFPYQKDLLTYRTAFHDDRVRDSDLPVVLKYVGDSVVTIWRARDGSVLWTTP